MKRALPGAWTSFVDFVDRLPDGTTFLGPWTSERRAHHQREMFGLVRNEVSEPVDLLEFGSGQGRGTTIAADVFTSAHTRIFGFDTFLGLPEPWRGRIPGYQVHGRSIRSPGPFEIPQGTFSTDARTPADTGCVQDPRVAFHPGLIQETLPEFLRLHRRARRLVAMIDVDLNSTTNVILAELHAHLRRGDVLIFDEFYDELGEFRAFADYLEQRKGWRNWRVIGHDGKTFAFSYEPDRDTG